MPLKANTVVMIVSLVAAAISAFFAWHISTLDEINNLRSDLTALQKEVPEAHRSQIEAISQSALPPGLLERDEISELIRTQTRQMQSILDGAVVAFNYNGVCPDGWDRFQEADGRVIVGAGIHRQQENGEKVVAFRFGSDGGTRRHGLSIPEMPRHDHDLFWGQYNGRAGPATGGDIKGHSLKIVDMTQNTGLIGNGVPHENMPPYKVLLYCRKTP